MEYGSLIMLVVLFAVMYFMMIRPQKKKEKEIQNMRNTLSQGDEVITIGGIHGKVVKVSDEIVVVELSHGKQRLEFSKWAIGSVAKKGKEKIEDKQEIVEEIDLKADDDKDKE